MSGVNKTGGVLTSIVITKQRFDYTHHQITDDDCFKEFFHGTYSFHKYME